ncbi:hypothetical protein ENSA5_49670 [Enhygromyxa salina]|uniref:Uncharacterized protein n=1 Tax=Enhygromyxa salina TaxID=215803 RepID=A0A2S9XHI6_9BACT|nr:hypothetical protein ENSA5_49670 [Enhygromyxa salina]
MTTTLPASGGLGNFQRLTALATHLDTVALSIVLSCTIELATSPLEVTTNLIASMPPRLGSLLSPAL